MTDVGPAWRPRTDMSWMLDYHFPADNPRVCNDGWAIQWAAVRESTGAGFAGWGWH